MYGNQRSYPSPYDYPSADDYYQAVEDYEQWLKGKEKADAEAADLAYEKKIEDDFYRRTFATPRITLKEGSDSQHEC